MLLLAAQQPLTEIQRLTVDDGELDREITLKALASAPEAYKTTVDEALARSADEWRRLAQTRLAKFVARQDGELVGMAAVVDHDRPDTVELVSMFVAPEARGSGASDRLVQSVVDWARDNGFRNVVLWTKEENLYADTAYRRQGFGWTGREEEGPSGLRVEMYCPIGDSDWCAYDTGRAWP